jgi:hypothetical protein
MTVPAMAGWMSGAAQKLQRISKNLNEGRTIGMDALPHARAAGDYGMLQNWIRDKRGAFALAERMTRRALDCHAARNIVTDHALLCTACAEGIHNTCTTPAD